MIATKMKLKAFNDPQIFIENVASTVESKTNLTQTNAECIVQIEMKPCCRPLFAENKKNLWKYEEKRFNKQNFNYICNMALWGLIDTIYT